MDAKALAHAKTRLSQAEKAVEALRSTNNFDEIERSWSLFIMSLGTIYTKLEKGSKSSPESNAWFQSVKVERKSDTLLQYLHQARNADEHGIIDITTRDSRELVQPIRLPNGKTAALKFQLPAGSDTFTVTEREGQNSFVGPQTVSDAVALVPVTNRGVFFPVPTSHQGVPFTAVGVLNVAEAGLIYARSLVSAADALVV